MKQRQAFELNKPEPICCENPKALAHHKEGDHIVLTAGARDLQRFVFRHLGEDELFEKPGEMIRRTNSVPAVTPPVSQ
jgi:hypothetical protein